MATKWHECETEHGIPYHYNAETDTVAWNKPKVLMSEEELAEDTYKYFWIRKFDTRVWVAAMLIAGDSASTKTGATKQSKKVFQQYGTDGIVLTPKPKFIGPAINNFKALQRDDLYDLVHLDEDNEQSVLFVLRHRYFADKFYTSIGDVLVAVNPFKETNAFTLEEQKKYSQMAKIREPHPYLVPRRAYRNIRKTGENQSIILTGESGSGKTFTACKCLEYLTALFSNDALKEQQINAANTVLQAFGHARTTHNDNSSRFSKILHLDFDDTHRVAGCRLIASSLEKERVVNMDKGERSFHIFYYLTKHARLEDKNNLDLAETAAYSYLNQSTVLDGDTHDDKAELEALEKAFKTLKFRMFEIETLMRMVSAVLNLGNVKFEDQLKSGKKACKIKRGKHIYCEHAASMLQIDAEALTQLLIRKGKADRKQARETRDKLAKMLYGKMFEWLVRRLNQVINPSADEERVTHTISIVDLSGFEVMSTNSLEHLLRNIANEKLQQIYNECLFLEDFAIYAREGVPFKEPKYHDSNPLLELVGLGRQSDKALFHMLDKFTQGPGAKTSKGPAAKALQRPAGVNKKFLASIFKRPTSKSGATKEADDSPSAFRYFKRTKGATKDTHFVVEHYTGPIPYCVTNFVETNKLQVATRLQALMESSSSELMKQFCEKSPKDDTTLSGRFLKLLKELQVSIKRNASHFIRCIKPNKAKLDNKFRSENMSFNALAVLMQLKYSALFQTIDNKKRGYLFRMKHLEFYRNYRFIVPEILAKEARHEQSTEPIEKQIQNLLSEMSEMVGLESMANVQIGKTMCMYRFVQHEVLERHREEVMQEKSHVLQNFYRSIGPRKLRKKLRALFQAIKSALRVMDKDAMAKALADPTCDEYNWKIVKQVRSCLNSSVEGQELISRLNKDMKRSITQLYKDPQVEKDIARFTELDREDGEVSMDEAWMAKVRVLKRLMELYRTTVKNCQELKDDPTLESMTFGEKMAKFTAIEKLKESTGALCKSCLHRKLVLPGILDKWYSDNVSALKLEAATFAEIAAEINNSRVKCTKDPFEIKMPESTGKDEIDRLFSEASAIIKSPDAVLLLDIVRKMIDLRCQVVAELKKSEMLVSSSGWAAVMKLAMQLEANLPQEETNLNTDTIKIISKEVRAIKRLDNKLKEMEPVASNLRQLLRSFPHLINANQNNIRTRTYDLLLAMIMANGGYFDKLLQDKAGDVKALVGPPMRPGTSNAEQHRAKRVQRLKMILDDAEIKELSKHPCETIVSLFSFAQEQSEVLSGRGLGDWEEVLYGPELDSQTGNPLVQTTSPFMKCTEPEFLHDFGYEDKEYDVEDQTQKSYMYNIKTGSMIPSAYMLEILPEPKPQPKGRYHPECPCCQNEKEGSVFPCNDLVAEELLLQAIGWEDAGLSDSMSIGPSVCLPSTLRSDNQTQVSADTAFFYNMHTGEKVKTLENIVNIKLQKQSPRHMGPNTRRINNDPVCPTPHAAWVALKIMVGGGFGTELMSTSHVTQDLVETSDAGDETDGDLSMIEEIARLREEAAMLLGREIHDSDLDQFSSEESEDPDVQISIKENGDSGELLNEFDILSPSLLGGDAGEQLLGGDADEPLLSGDADEPIKREIEERNRELLSFFALTPKEIADKMSMSTPSHVHLSDTGNGWWEYGPDDDRSNRSLENLYRKREHLRERFAKNSLVAAQVREECEKISKTIENRDRHSVDILKGFAAGFYTIVFDCEYSLGLRFAEVSETDKRGMVAELLDVEPLAGRGTTIQGQAERMGVQVGDICTAVAGVDLWEFPMDILREKKQSLESLPITFLRNNWRADFVDV